MSDLPSDFAEDVLSRTSLRRFRSACKKWSFTKRHLAQAKTATKKKELPAKRRMMSDRSFTKRHLAQAKAATKKELPAKRRMMSDLPMDLAEEVLSRLPVTSLRGFRSACKNWNTLSKDRSFTEKHIAQAKAAAAREFMVVMVIDFRVYLMSLDLHGIDPSINRQGKLVSLDDSDGVDISEVYHCDGLLLCITKDFKRFVVWNPYSCQKLWLKPRTPHHNYKSYSYAIGYENGKTRRNYKVLRFVDNEIDTFFVEYEIYHLNSNSWRVLDVTSDWLVEFYARGVSLKGNTYWFAQDKYPDTGPVEGPLGYDIADFLICFDFTRERFGPRLPLPFHSKSEDTVSLSSVREEQLAVLFQPWDTLHMEIWVTTKIEPEVALWSKVFLAVDMQPLIDCQFGVTNGSFFIDEEKKLVVVLDKDKDVVNPIRNTAYIIGEDGYFREVDLGKSTEDEHYPLGCSYVPSAMQIKQ